MKLTWLNTLDAWVIVLVLWFTMMLGAEVAFQVGRRLNTRVKDTSKSHFTTVVGSLLGLLALLLSFTFGMSTQRYEARRLLLIDDVNAIGTFYLRCSLLPESQRRQIKPILRQYVDLRPQAVPLDNNAVMFEDREARSRALLFKMWHWTRALAEIQPEVKGAGTAVNSLIDLVGSHTRRLSALTNRVPDTVIWMLLGAAVAGMGVIGYSAGLGDHRGMPARLMLSLLVCGTIYVVLDLDRPNRGAIKIDQAPMIRLQQLIDNDPETQGGTP